jgi:WD40 repeat protein
MDTEAQLNGHSIVPQISGADANAAPALPISLPDHQLLRCIGHGSYGEVWLARNMMGTYRAAKIVFRRSFKNQKPFEREWSGIRKFEPISRSHEGFIDILQVGLNQEQGFFYYVMELGDGEVAAAQRIEAEAGSTSGKSDRSNNHQPATPPPSTVEGWREDAPQDEAELKCYSPKTLGKEILRQGRLPLLDCLQLGLALSRAVAELHKHGLVHRDIKPANIIFVNGVPKLADIGLVAEFGEALTFVGTEGFIPPEGPGSAQADVYSLGKVLYEACTGYDRQEFPELPPNWNTLPNADGLTELNEVILRACKPKPADRYQSAWDMYTDLLVVADGKSVKRLRLLERRLAGLKRAAGLSVILLAVVALAGFQLYREHKFATEARQREVGANIAYGNRALDSGDLSGALPYFAETLYLERGSESLEQNHRLRLGSVLAQCPKLLQVGFVPRELAAVEFSPDGQSLLTLEKRGKAQVFSTDGFKPLSPRFGPELGSYQASFSPDGALVVTASPDSTACIWKVPQGSKLFCLEHPRPVTCARFSPNGLRVVTGSEDAIARVWDPQTGTIELKLEGHTGVIIFATFSRDGRFICTTSQDSTARIWDAIDGHQIGGPLLHSTWAGYADFSPDNSTLATACYDHWARLWDVKTGRQLLPALEHDDGISSVEFSPDGRLIVTAGLDHVARLWLTENHQPLNPNPILRHSDRVTHAGFAADGHRIVTSCTDGTVGVWDLAGSTVAPSSQPLLLSDDMSRFITVNSGQLQVFDTLTRQPISPLLKASLLSNQAKLSPDGEFLLTVTASPDVTNRALHSVTVWNAAAGRPVGPALALANTLASMSLSRNGKRLLVFDHHLAQTWDVATGTRLAQCSVQDGDIQSASFSPSGEAIAAWTEQVVALWDSATGAELFPPRRHSLPVKWIEFSPNSSQFVTCEADPDLTKCQAQVWNVANGQPVGDALKHGDGVLSASFSADGTLVGTASEDYTAMIWDIGTGAKHSRPLRHKDQVGSIAFSPDAKWVFTTSWDKTARVWNVGTGDPLTPSLRHLRGLTKGRFLADARHLVMTDAVGNAWIWDLPVDDRPVEDLRLLARLLAGDTVTPSGNLPSSEPLSPAAIWQRLRTRYPASFTTSPEEISAWHEYQAAASELQQQWSAAGFHLRQLLRLHPGDEAILKRIETNTTRLSISEAKDHH